MATLLQRLGRSSAAHAPRVIALWAVLLVAAVLVGTFAAGTYTTSLTIPGTPAQTLADRLETELPDAARGTGTVTFTPSDGEEFTDAEKEAIGKALDAAGDVDGVYAVMNPFETQADLEDQLSQLDSAPAQLEQGQAQLDEGTAQLEDGQSQLDAAKEQLAQGREQLEAARAQIPDVPTDQLPAEAQAQVEELDAQQAQLEAGEKELADQQAQLDQAAQDLEDGQAELSSKQAEFEDGKRLLDIVGDYAVVSDDNTAAIATITFDTDVMSVSDDTKAAVTDAIDSNLGDDVTAYYSQEIARDLSSIFGPTEAIGLLVAAIVLLLMLRAVTAAVLPILTALVGVGITVMATAAMANVIDMHEISPVLGIMLGLAVGIDYTLFVVNRHRDQLSRGMAVDESIGLAVGTSGNAVTFAGLTVIVALVALNVVGIPFLGILGNVAAFAVLIAVLLTITLTPAVLHLVGYRVLPKKRREKARSLDRVVAAHDANGTKRDPIGTRHPWIASILSIVVLAVIAIPFFSMRLGLPDGSSEDVGSDAYESYQITSESFGPGRNGPLIVVAHLPSDLDDATAEAMPLDIGEKLADLDGVVSVTPIGSSDDGSMTAFQVIGSDGPSAEETQDLVHSIRDLSPMDIDGDRVDVDVTGMTAMTIDVSEKLSDALPIYLGVVVVISFLLLMVVFRSLLVPFIATVGFLFSLLAAMGAVVAIYQWGWLSDIFGVANPGPVLSFLPTLMIGILFGLAMDYQLFLTTGMREAWAHGRPAKRAIVDGIFAGRRVVIAAALIMFSVFAGFVFAELSMIRPIGFGMAVGVLFDAFVVRMTLIPAVMTILGESAWWLPKWLEKILPSVDVEGTSIEEAAQSGDEAEPGTGADETESEPKTEGKHARPADGEVSESIGSGKHAPHDD